jgi:polysaccharide export outer membrane protein
MNRFMASLAAVVLLLSCGPIPLSAQNAVSAIAPAATNPAVVSASGEYALDEKHKLAAGDKLSFRIVEDREAPKSLLVTDSGELDVPYIGRVMATDKTCKQLAGELKTQLEKEYYYRATVILGLDSVSKTRGRIYIWGQVHKQGAIEIPANENFTAGKAILQAGGFGDFANKKKVKIIRTNTGGEKQTFELNMVDILEAGKTEKDMALQEDDFIIVPSKLINF